MPEAQSLAVYEYGMSASEALPRTSELHRVANSKTDLFDRADPANAVAIPLESHNMEPVKKHYAPWSSGPAMMVQFYF